MKEKRWVLLVQHRKRWEVGYLLVFLLLVLLAKVSDFTESESVCFVYHVGLSTDHEDAHYTTLHPTTNPIPLVICFFSPHSASLETNWFSFLVTFFVCLFIWKRKGVQLCFWSLKFDKICTQVLLFTYMKSTEGTWLQTLNNYKYTFIAKSKKVTLGGQASQISSFVPLYLAIILLN